MSRALRIAVTTRSRRVCSPRKAARLPPSGWRRSSARGMVSSCPPPGAEGRHQLRGAHLRDAEEPFHIGRVRRSWSSFSSCRMASGMASSQRGLAGTALPGEPLLGLEDGRLGWHLAATGRSQGRRWGWVVHKGSYGTVEKAQEPEPSKGAAARRAAAGCLREGAAKPVPPNGATAPSAVESLRVLKRCCPQTFLAQRRLAAGTTDCSVRQAARGHLRFGWRGRVA